MTSRVAAVDIPAIIGNESSGGVAVKLSISAKVGEIEKGDEGIGGAEMGDGRGEGVIGEVGRDEGERDQGERGKGDEGEGDEGGVGEGGDGE